MRLLHISDTHAYVEGTSDAVELAKYLGVQIVHTGDIVQDFYQQSVDYMDLGAVWPVIGNHDAINQSGTDPAGYHWHDRPSQQQLRAKFYDPFPARGLVFGGSNATWWHKDMPDCRIIGLDVTALGDDLALESTWLRATLNDIPTVVLAHIGPRNLAYEANSFTDYSYWSDPAWYGDSWSNVYPGIAQLSNIVFAHAETSGTPTVMLCGHEHVDGAIVHRGVPIITVGSIVQDPSGIYRSTVKDTSRLVSNLVTFTQHSLVVQRLGADSRANGSRAKMWAYSYDNNRVTAIVSQ